MKLRFPFINSKKTLNKKRLRAFEKRQENDVTYTIDRYPNAKYVTIHPFADDHELLEKIGWEPMRCVSVDAYLRVDNEIFFVESLTAQHSDNHQPGLYAGLMFGDPGITQITFIVEEAVITSGLFDRLIHTLLEAEPNRLLASITDRKLRFIHPPNW
ncbi:MAG: hypothetical protein AAF085_13675 [Planctomycetota bacterium]